MVQAGDNRTVAADNQMDFGSASIGEARAIDEGWMLVGDLSLVQMPGERRLSACAMTWPPPA